MTTPNFAGYVSGHSTFSRAGAEVMALLTGSPFFPGGLKEFDFEAAEYLQVEYGPSEDLTVQVATYYDAADITGVARIYCGVHIAADDFVGRQVGARVGVDAVLKTLALRQGENAQPGFSQLRIQTLLTSEDQAALVSYQAKTQLPTRIVQDIDDVDDTAPAAIYASQANEGDMVFLFTTESISQLNGQGHASGSRPLILDFSIEGEEPVVLLAKAEGLEQGELALYQNQGKTYQLLSNNLNWLQNDSASLSYTFSHRDNFSGTQQLPPSANALPLTLSAGEYRLTLAPSNEEKAPASLSLEQIEAP